MVGGMEKTHWGPRYPVVDLACKKKINYEILSLWESDNNDSEDQAQLEASSDSEEESEGGNKGFIGTCESSVMISTSQAPTLSSLRVPYCGAKQC